MRPALIVAAVVAVGALGACGATSKTKPALPPAQYENAQRIGGYVEAIKKFQEPFVHPPSEPTNYAKAIRLSQTAFAEVSALTPPPQFKVAHEKLVSALREQQATGHAFLAAQRAHDATGINNAEAKNVREGEAIRAVLMEIESELERCRTSNYSC